MAPTLASVATTATQVAAAAATHVIIPILKRAEEEAAEAAGGEEEDACAASYDDSHWGLRIGGIFIILATSSLGTLAPISSRSSRVVPRAFFEFVKYFGSGVIIATAFMHSLAPAFDELGSECLSGTWNNYDWAPAFALISCMLMFFAEVAAYRIGTQKSEQIGVNYSSHVHDETDAHAHDHRAPSVVAGQSNPANLHSHALEHEIAHEHHPNINGHGLGHHGPMPDGPTEAEIYGESLDGGKSRKKVDLESGDSDSALTLGPSDAETAAQIVGVAILEFGVVSHSIIIGLTLATSDEFIVLFIVIIFHQMFEGLGLGARLASLESPKHLWWVRYAAALSYCICTPVGMAAGLGVRKSYNGNGTANLIVSGILDAISAGISLYTGLVELLAHEILLNPRMMKSSNSKLAYVFICMCLGAGLMALLANWA